MTRDFGLRLEVFEALFDGFSVGIGHDIGRKVHDFFEIFYGDIQQLTDCGRRATHEPNVRYRRSQTDVAHSLTARNALGDYVAIFVDRCFTRADAFQLWVVWINVLDWSKNALAEQAITFWFLGAIVNRFWLRDFAVAPVKNVFFACYGEAN